MLGKILISKNKFLLIKRGHEFLFSLVVYNDPFGTDFSGARELTLGLRKLTLILYEGANSYPSSNPTQGT